MDPRLATPEEKAANLAALRETLALFPGLTEATVGGWFVNCTPYPFASLPDCMPGVRVLAARSKGDHDLAVTLVDEDVERAMANPLPAD